MYIYIYIHGKLTACQMLIAAAAANASLRAAALCLCNRLLSQLAVTACCHSCYYRGTPRNVKGSVHASASVSSQ